MGNLFKFSSLILMAIGSLGLLGLIFKLLNPSQLSAATAYGAVELVLVTGVILQILYRVTEGEL